jgi:hypothetical protein
MISDDIVIQSHYSGATAATPGIIAQLARIEESEQWQRRVAQSRKGRLFCELHPDYTKDNHKQSAE